MSQESVNLYFREGSSDKVFNLQLVNESAGWIVRSQNGRRGSTLTNREVTTGHVSYEIAKAAYDGKLKSKLKDGYTTHESGSAFAQSENAGRVSGLLPQLLNPVEEPLVHGLLNDSNHYVQVKHDGEHLLTKKTDGKVIGANRKGLVIGLAQTIHDDLATLPFDFELDGEGIGDHYYVFDILSLAGIDYTSKTFHERAAALDTLQSTRYVHFIGTARTPSEKIALFNKVKADKGEGIVLKKAAASYKPGKPSSGGDMLKFKFKETCSVVVTAIHSTKRSVSMGLFENSQIIDVGNVAIPVNKTIPAVGDVVEVEYLYAFPNGGSLFQPVYLSKRHDIDQEECLIKQLKFKPELQAA